jgi:hypothetical protein
VGPSHPSRILCRYAYLIIGWRASHRRVRSLTWQEALPSADWDITRSPNRVRLATAHRATVEWHRFRDATGSTVVFETSLDDYAGIWVDGELTRSLG